jgi:hypothetical protein
MHSEEAVPAKYRVQLSLPAEFSTLASIVNSISSSPLDDIVIQRHGSTLFDVLQGNKAYHTLFLENGPPGTIDLARAAEVLFANVAKTRHMSRATIATTGAEATENIFSWIRDVVTLLTYEACTLCEQKVIPVFNNPDVLLGFLRHGGLLIKPATADFERPVVEIVQENVLEIVFEATEWAAIKEIKKDRESAEIVRSYHRIIEGSTDITDPERLRDQIDDTIESFEEVIQKFGLQCKKSRRHLFLDAANLSVLGGLTLYSTLLGVPPQSTSLLLTLIGASIATSKTFFSLREQRIVTRPTSAQIGTYLKAVRDTVISKFPQRTSDPTD